MNTPRAQLIRRWAGMCLAGLAGVAIALGSRSTADSSSYRAARSIFSSVSKASAKRDRIPANSSITRYHDAWRELVSQSLPEQERRTAAVALLKQWAGRDLKGAMSAAIEANKQGWGPLNEAFDREILDRPEAFIPFFENQQFGLDAAALRERWTSSVARRAPLLLVQHLTLVPAPQRPDVLKRSLAALAKHPDQATAFMHEISKLPDTPLNAQLRQMAATHQSSQP